MMKKTDSSYFNMNSFKEDNIRAVDAKFEAQKIAFAPLCFQAVRAMLELGLLKAIEDLVMTEFHVRSWRRKQAFLSMVQAFFAR